MRRGDVVTVATSGDVTRRIIALAFVLWLVD